jgi:DNA-binding transcriptional LysR family regulator
MWRHIRYFLKAAETLHFGQAAKLLGVSPQPLGKAIRELETEVGTALFLRTTRTVSLTPAGERLRDLGALAFAQLDEALNAARQIGREQRGTLDVGYFGALASLSDYPHRLVKVFAREHAEYTPRLSILQSQDLQGALVRGEIDVALMVSDPDMHARLESQSATRLRLFLAVPRAHRFRNRKAIATVDLSREKLILSSTRLRPGLLATAKSLFARHGLKLRVGHEAEDEARAIEMVRQGLGVTLVSSKHSLPGVHVVELADQPTLEVVFAWRRSDKRASVSALRSLAHKLPP